MEVAIHWSPGHDEDPAELATEGNEMKRLASESIPVEQGQNFATSTETLGRDQQSKMSDVLAHLRNLPSAGGIKEEGSHVFFIFGTTEKNTGISSHSSWEHELVTRSTLRNRMIITKMMTFDHN